jgi:hypothetical protein
VRARAECVAAAAAVAAPSLAAVPTPSVAPFTLSCARADGLLKNDDGSAAPRGSMTAGTEGARDALTKVSVARSLAECVDGRNLIIEAVPDYADIKGGVFREAIQHCAKDAVLTTNTLSVTLQEICVRNPSRVSLRPSLAGSNPLRPDLGARLSAPRPICRLSGITVCSVCGSSRP